MSRSAKKDRKQQTEAAKKQPTQPANQPVGECDTDKKLVQVRWDPEGAWCSDDVKLKANAKNFDANTDGSADVKLKGGGTVASLSGKGKDSFELPWTVKDVPFTGASMPDEHEVEATFKAAGFTKDAQTPLTVKRVPDNDAGLIKFNISAGGFGWDGVFRVAVEKDEIKIHQKMQSKKAWMGKWVSFDSSTADGKDGWFFIKKVGTRWKYWDDGADPKVWKNLPRGISDYTVTEMFFEKKGTDFEDVDGGGHKWPEAFPEPTNYDTKKTFWKSDIERVWDNKLKLVHKDCKSANDKKCAWKIREKWEWLEGPGDEFIYLVWSQEYERSDSQHWYLADNDVGFAAHEAGHLLGAYDEYTGGATDPAGAVIEDDSVMGNNMSKAIPRHLNNLRDKVKAKINNGTGKSWEFEVKDI